MENHICEHEIISLLVLVFLYPNGHWLKICIYFIYPCLKSSSLLAFYGD